MLKATLLFINIITIFLIQDNIDIQFFQAINLNKNFTNIFLSLLKFSIYRFHFRMNKKKE